MDARLVDTKLEATILGSCLLRPHFILNAPIHESDFASTAHQVIWRGMFQLHADGELHDTTSLVTYLADRDQLAMVGGDMYLIDLVDHAAPWESLPVDRLRRLSRQRRLRLAGQQLAISVDDPQARLRYQREIDALLEQLAEIDSGVQKAPSYMVLSEFFQREVRPVGVRLTTSFPSLDESMRGGLPPSQLISLLGAPGARKTSLVTHWAHVWEQSGCAVVILAGDEAGSKVAIRLGQLAGFSRDAIEEEGELGDGIRAGVVRRLAERRIVLIDPRVAKGVTTIESAERVLLHFAGDRPRVLIVDSLQSVYTEAAFHASDERERVTLGINVCRAIADRGSIVVAISEMSRAGYRTGDRATDISVLASAKESGRVEYASDLVIGARPVFEEPMLVDLEVGKSRPGAKVDLRLSFDPDRASFREVALPDPNAERQGAAQRRLDLAKERVRTVLKQHQDLTSAREVLTHCDGTRAHNLDAFNDMLKRGEVVKVGDVYRNQGGS